MEWPLIPAEERNVWEAWEPGGIEEGSVPKLVLRIWFCFRILATAGAPRAVVVYKIPSFIISIM